ncbi:hypothetical protein [Mesorhizobium shangrilense]|uniref:Uncharacterized protein n=1 Tax=Mesorhizobium shangrilense TaxID=460060 RepID=A0ABV2DQE5_9HYPH
MKDAEPKQRDALVSEVLTKVTTSMRKGDLGMAARLLGSLDRDRVPTATEVTLVSRLSRMIAAALRGPLDEQRLVELIAIAIQLSPTNEVAVDLSRALAQGLRTQVASTIAQGESIPSTFDLLVTTLPLLSSKRVDGELFDAVLFVAQHIPDTSELTQLLCEMAGQWRKVGFDSLSSERIEGLTQIASRHLTSLYPGTTQEENPP